MNVKHSKVLSASALALVSGLFVSGSALAQQGWYMYGAVGHSDFKVEGGKGGIDSDLTGAGVLGLSSTLDETSVGYKLQLGYMFTPNFGVEGGWVDLGKVKYNATFTGGSASANVKASGFNLAVIGVMPLNNSFSLFGKLGTIDAKVKGSITATGGGAAVSGNASSTDWNLNYGLGVMYNLTPKMAIRAEWERFDKLGDRNQTGRADNDLWSIGLKVSF